MALKVRYSLGVALTVGDDEVLFDSDELANPALNGQEPVEDGMVFVPIDVERERHW